MTIEEVEKLVEKGMETLRYRRCKVFSDSYGAPTFVPLGERVKPEVWIKRFLTSQKITKLEDTDGEEKDWI